MTTTRIFGRLPTLAEMTEYYALEDMLDFLYDECQCRNIDIAFRKKRWPIKPTSKAHLREIINDTIEKKIKNAYLSACVPHGGLRSKLLSLRTQAGREIPPAPFIL